MARVRKIELLCGPLDGKEVTISGEVGALPRIVHVERYQVALSNRASIDTHIECFCGVESEGSSRYRLVASADPQVARYVWAP